MPDTYARLNAAAHSGAFGVNELALPSAEQCRAGNYRKGRVVLQGMPVMIEVPQGQRRMGKTDGQPWSTILMAHYGYLAGTKGADGDALDVFIGPVPESARVWVVNQVGKAGAFDEHKILLGFIDEESARAAYMNSYERGWTGLGSLVACSIDQLKWWIKFGNLNQPLTERALPHDGNNEMNVIVWDSAANPVGCDLGDLVYRMRRDDSEGLMLDAVSATDILEDADSVMTLDALVVPMAKAERKADQLRKVMDAAGQTVKPVSVQVIPPFKKNGTTNVVILFELSDGQTVSIWMHNPDSTPNKILPTDELVSWSWRLNKKDVSILVAPEKGQDLNPREVASRIMRLAEKNSARFAKANTTRAERMANIESLKGAVSSKEADLAALDALHGELTDKVEAKRAAAIVASTTPPSRSVAVKEELAKLGWDVVAGSTIITLNLDGSTYSLKADQSGKDGIVWRDTGGGGEWADEPSLSAAEMATKIDGEFRAAVAQARATLQTNDQEGATRPLDPTTPEGYAAVSEDESLLIAHQDQLDHFFGGRLIAVRNALRDLGWDGPKFKELSKGGFALKQNLKQVGAGANIVGVTYEIEGVAGFFMSDTLTRTPQELAEGIDRGLPQVQPESLADIARRLVPAEFESRIDPDGLTFMAADGYGIRLVRSRVGNSVLGYVLDAKGQDGLGSRGTDEAQIKDLIDTALGVIAESRAASAPSGVIITFGTDQSSDSAVLRDRDQWMASNIDGSQLNTSGDEGVGDITLADGSVRLVYRLNDGKLAYWDMATRSMVEVSEGDTSLQIRPPSETEARVAAIADELVRLGWTKTPEGKGFEMKSPNGHDVVIIEDNYYAGVIEIQGAPVSDNKDDAPSVTADRIDRDDWLSAAPFATDGDIVDDDDHEMSGKTVEFAYSADALKAAVAAQDGIVVWGDFTPSLAQGGLFDSASGPQYGLTAQIGKDGAVLGRANIDEQGSVTIYSRANGEDVFGTATSKADIWAVVGRLFAEYVPAAVPEPAPVPAAMSRLDWEEAVYQAIEERGIARSDAQGIVEAQGSRIDDLFAAGSTPADAAAAFLEPSDPEDDPQLTEAKAFLQSVIGGDVDYMDPALPTKLEEIHGQYVDDDEVMSLFNDAANAFSDHMIALSRQSAA